MRKEAPLFVHGIPTRADVKDYRYQDVVRRLELKKRLGELFPVPLIVSRHVQKALMEAKDGISDPLEILRTGAYRPSLGQRWSGVAREFRDSLNPSSVFEQLMERVGRYEETVDEARPFLPIFDRGSFITITLPERLRPVPWPQEIKETGSAKGEGWAYTFKPGLIFRKEMVRLRQNLWVAMREYDPLKQLQALWMVLGVVQKDVVWQKFLRPALTLTEGKSHYDLEADGRTRTGHLAKKHMEMAAGSDAYVTFDLQDLILNKGTVTFERVDYAALIALEQRFTRKGLTERTKVRDFFSKRLKNNGDSVRVNGVEIKREHNGLWVDQEIPGWLVNLLPLTVIVRGDGLIRIEGWADREAILVLEYRDLPLNKASEVPFAPEVKAILKQYGGFTPRGEKTMAPEKLKLLLGSLGYED